LNPIILKKKHIFWLKEIGRRNLKLTTMKILALVKIKIARWGFRLTELNIDGLRDYG
jgi:hypothetical protein